MVRPVTSCVQNATRTSSRADAETTQRSKATPPRTDAPATACTSYGRTSTDRGNENERHNYKNNPY